MIYPGYIMNQETDPKALAAVSSLDILSFLPHTLNLNLI